MIKEVREGVVNILNERENEWKGTLSIQKADKILTYIASVLPEERKWSINTPQPDRTMNYTWNECLAEVKRRLSNA